MGADLYLGIRVLRGGSVVLSKGMLAQAKLGTHLTPEERLGLTTQCKRMLIRTNASYVWICTSEGVRVVTANDVIRRQSRNLVGGRRLDEMLSETLSCHEGDLKIGLPTGGGLRQQVGSMLEELGARTGISMTIIAPTTHVEG